MARPLRIEFSGALYHISNRGNGGDDIYLDDDDRMLFNEVLSEVCEQFNWFIYAWCQMNNHYHLLIETPDANLSKGMRYLNGVYTQRFNRKHQRVGRVFQGRFKGILIERDAYLLELCRYIVLNPVRSGMVASAEDWVWSSYRYTAGLEAPFKWFDQEWMLSLFAKTKKRAMKAYCKFVADGIHQASPWQSLQNQIYLGSDDFVIGMQKRIKQDPSLSHIPYAHKRAVPKPIKYYVKNSQSRNEAIHLAYRSGGYSLEKLGEYFKLHTSSISRIAKTLNAKNKA